VLALSLEFGLLLLSLRLHADGCCFALEGEVETAGVFDQGTDAVALVLRLVEDGVGGFGLEESVVEAGEEAIEDGWVRHDGPVFAVAIFVEEMLRERCCCCKKSPQ
jgi:hypothetical protein